MAEFTQYLTSGLALGAIYGLVALGFVVIYRASQVFNFAHGELLTFGAVVMVYLSARLSPTSVKDSEPRSSVVLGCRGGSPSCCR